MRASTRVGVMLLLALTGIAMFARTLAPNDPIVLHQAERLQAPSRAYPLGTDELGRCVLSRLLYGVRLSLGIAFAVVAISAALGTTAGLAAGYGDWLTDELIMRAADAFLAVPGLVLALVIVGLLRPGAVALIGSLGAVGWMGYARVVRSVVMSTRHAQFVEAARTAGASAWYILGRHMLPEVLRVVRVLAAAGMSGAIISVAALNFLGLGLQPPAADWGSMLQAARPYLRVAPSLAMYPGGAILLTTFVFRLIGEGLEERA